MNQHQQLMRPPPPPLPQATQLSSLSTSSTSIHAVNLPQTSSFVSNNINGSNINPPRQVAEGVISKINVSPPEVAASNKSNISRGGAEVERQRQPIYGGNNGTTHTNRPQGVRFSHKLKSKKNPVSGRYVRHHLVSENCNVKGFSRNF